jgi:hypothetical protein
MGQLCWKGREVVGPVGERRARPTRQLGQLGSEFKKKILNPFWIFYLLLEWIQMDLKARIEDQGNLNLTQDLNSKESLNIFKEWKFDKEDFEVLSELENWLGSGMKFESTDLIQIEGYSTSRSRVWLKELSKSRKV